MYFKDIKVRRSIKNRIINMVDKGVTPHAQLFVSKSGAGALSLAIATAQYINCLNPNNGDSCGKCHSCKKYDIYAHPDLFFLFPIINKNSKNLCDDHLQEWREFLNKGAYTTYKDWLELQNASNKKAVIFAREGDSLTEKLSYRIAEAKKRIIIIWLPEKMHSSLANKLLKLTEEPPENTFIIMVSENEKEVLGTLRSRMQNIYITPILEDEMNIALEEIGKYDPEEISNAAHLSNGNVRKAIDILTNSQNHKDELLEIYKRVMRSTVNAVPLEMKALSEEIATLSRDDQQSLILYISKMFRECYIYNLDIDSINYLNNEEKSIANYIKGCINSNNIESIISEFKLAIRHISQNVNSKIVFYDLLLRITSKLTASYKGKGVR